MKTALITGITGQDGSYLAEFLLKKEYTVYGLIRRNSYYNLNRIENIKDKINLIYGDLVDQTSLIKAIVTAAPDEIYNLGAQSFVHLSWNQPINTSEINSMGVLKLLDAIKTINPKIKMYQASTSEIFGNTPPPQNESSPYNPQSIYGISKLFSHLAVQNYRKSYNMFLCSGILFNHESPRRGLEFVTRKISYNVAKIYLGLADKIELGNLQAKRDWGFAGDYVEAMWLMLQQEEPDDYVIATGKAYSIEDFVREAFKVIGISNYKDYIEINKKYFRPADVNYLLGDASKAREKLNWQPKMELPELVKLMVKSDIELLSKKSKNLKAEPYNEINELQVSNI